MSRTGFRRDLDSGCRPGGEEILRCHVETEELPEELLERGVRLALESGRPIAHVARDLGIHSETCGSGCARRRPITA